IENGQLIHNLKGHKRPISSLSVKDGMLFSGSYDRTIKVWDLGTGQLLQSLDSHKGLVSCLSVKDGMLISGSSDKKIKIWDFTPRST
ncbi:MAG: WD40 repeat domain-containing protein, partial [Verrucomicrobia bacterium]|nr:WD40 repeat domain-containing protein [Verrucomicrobiota bacterium]